MQEHTRATQQKWGDWKWPRFIRDCAWLLTASNFEGALVLALDSPFSCRALRLASIELQPLIDSLCFKYQEIPMAVRASKPTLRHLQVRLRHLELALKFMFVIIRTVPYLRLVRAFQNKVPYASWLCICPASACAATCRLWSYCPLHCKVHVVIVQRLRSSSLRGSTLLSGSSNK